MRILRLLGLLVCCTLCGPLAGSTGPDDRALTDPKSVVSASDSAARPVPVDDLYYTRSVFGAAWSPDGQQIVFTTDISGRSNLWKVRASGGWPIQLTQSDDRQYSAAWSPDGKWIVYQQDHAGDELWDLFAIPTDGGEAVNITNTPAIREQGPHWSHDGKTIAFAYKTKDGAQHDIALLDWSTRKVHKLTNEQQPGYSWSMVAWSNDDKKIYADRVNPPFTDADVLRGRIRRAARANSLTPNHPRACSPNKTSASCGETLSLALFAKSRSCWFCGAPLRGTKCGESKNGTALTPDGIPLPSNLSNLSSIAFKAPPSFPTSSAFMESTAFKQSRCR
jgi:dipeptidyl aminopeptidase/acylaminoacyl peptidase